MKYVKAMAVCSFAIMTCFLTGCAELSSMYEGATGGDITQVESPTFFKIGEGMMPILSQLIALFRMAFGF